MKTKSTHTPGLWTWSGHFCTGITANTPASEVTAVAHVTRDGGYITKEEAQANARLIAAAPDLLEAAQFAIKTVGDCNCDKVCCIHYQIEKMLRAAIKKATGESQ